MLDYLVIGNGLAANTVALKLFENNSSFKIFGNTQLSNCSKIAAGIWNPIVFKRMTKSWMADELIPELLVFYKKWEKEFDSKFCNERVIIKPFFSQEEKDFWLKKANSDLINYLDISVYKKKEEFGNLIIPNEYGVVKNCGNIDLPVFLKACQNFFSLNNHFIHEVFDYNLVQVNTDSISYKNIIAKNIIFCEGYLVKNNPYFNWIPLNPVKGEVMEIETTDLGIEKEIYNRNGFVFKLHESKYKVGATYNWKELNDDNTESGKLELENKLKLMINSPYKITSHTAGVRPSTIDRRPIIGAHPKLKNLFVFNGLGTKGVMLAPYFAKNFVNYLLKKEELNKEVSVERFY